ncbi:MAG: hypothetical protein CM15mP102_13090 [Flavobacteriales bacterium]|nr:MAG: hypothetical protein CM15mP102_13090 [Flavobacteriales bacterium]
MEIIIETLLFFINADFGFLINFKIFSVLSKFCFLKLKNAKINTSFLKYKTISNIESIIRNIPFPIKVSVI